MLRPIYSRIITIYSICINSGIIGRKLIAHIADLFILSPKKLDSMERTDWCIDSGAKQRWQLFLFKTRPVLS